MRESHSAEQTLCLALCRQAEPSVPVQLLTQSPVLPLQHLWSLVRPFLFPADRIAAVSSWLAANRHGWSWPCFSRAKKRKRFLVPADVIQPSQPAHFCPVERRLRGESVKGAEERGVGRAPCLPACPWLMGTGRDKGKAGGMKRPLVAAFHGQ